MPMTYGIYPCPHGSETYREVTPAELTANITRHITLTGRKPAFAILFQVGYSQPEFRFPVEQCLALQSLDVVPLILVAPEWDASRTPDRHRIPAILAGELDETIRAEARRSLDYKGPLIIAHDWETPNIGAEDPFGDGWVWSHDAEAIQVQADQSGTGMTTLDGKPWYTGPAAYVQAKRRWIDLWREGRDGQLGTRTLWLAEMCHSHWYTGKPWMHPKWWFAGAAYTDLIGGGVCPWIGAGAPQTLAQSIEPLLQDIGEIEGAEQLPFFLEVAHSRVPGFTPQPAFYRALWKALLNGTYPRLANGFLEIWEDYGAPYYWGPLAGQNAGMAVDATPQTLAAVREGTTDNRLLSSVFPAVSGLAASARG